MQQKCCLGLAVENECKLKMNFSIRSEYWSIDNITSDIINNMHSEFNFWWLFNFLLSFQKLLAEFPNNFLRTVCLGEGFWREERGGKGLKQHFSFIKIEEKDVENILKPLQNLLKFFLLYFLSYYIFWKVLNVFHIISSIKLKCCYKFSPSKILSQTNLKFIFL